MGRHGEWEVEEKGGSCERGWRAGRGSSSKEGGGKIVRMKTEGSARESCYTQKEQPSCSLSFIRDVFTTEEDSSQRPGVHWVESYGSPRAWDRPVHILHFRICIDVLVRFQ